MLNQAQDSLHNLITSANDSFLRYSAQQQTELGTTVCTFFAVRPAASAVSEWLACVIGDTRLYRLELTCNTATAPAIVQLSTDQTLANLTEAERARHSESIAHLQGMDESQVLSQCLGLTEDIKPVFLRGTCEPGTAFLLCSDGFRHELEAEEMLTPFLPHGNQAAGRQAKGGGAGGNGNNAADGLTAEDLSARLEALIQTNIKRGERDNITAILVQAAGYGRAKTNEPTPGEPVHGTSILGAPTPGEQTQRTPEPGVTEVLHA
jgi:serine/threonine protein phosphatase PrpC